MGKRMDNMLSRRMLLEVQAWSLNWWFSQPTFHSWE